MLRRAIPFIILCTTAIQAFALGFDDGGSGGTREGSVLYGATSNSSVVFTNSTGKVTTSSGLTYDGTSSLTIGDITNETKPGILVLRKDVDAALGLTDPTYIAFRGQSGSTGNHILWTSDEAGSTVTSAIYDGVNGSFSQSAGDIALWAGTSNSIRIARGSVVMLTASATGVALSTHVAITGRLSTTANTAIDAYNTSFGSITAGSTSTLTWTEVYDRASEFVTSSFTVVAAGQYEILAQAGVVQTAGSACLILKVNGTSPAGGTSCNAGVTALASTLPLFIPRILNLAANDIVRVDGSATTANGTFQQMQLTIKRVP